MATDGAPPKRPERAPAPAPAPGVPFQGRPPAAPPPSAPAPAPAPGVPFQGRPPAAPAPVPTPQTVTGAPFQGQAPAAPAKPGNPPERVGTPVADAAGRPAQPMPGGVAQMQGFKFGFSEDDAATMLPPGVTPLAQNAMAREGGVEPRYRLAAIGTNNVIKDVGLYVGEYSTVTGGRFTVAMSKSTFAFLLGSTWTSGSYSTQPTSDPMAGADTDYIDAEVVYHPTPDENGLVFVNGVDRAFFWGGPSSRTFSTLTNAPIAKTVAQFDSRVVFGNLTDTSTATRLVQRVQWSARGDPETYSEPTGGAEDLLDARGAITKIVAESDRLVIFFEYEIWVGYKADFPFDLQFVRLDPNIGCQAPWTVTRTPKGIAFLGYDNRPYLLPPGGTAVAVGPQTWKHIRQNIDTPTQAAGGYDPNSGEYVLAFPVLGGGGRPTKAVAANMEKGTWLPHTYAHTPARMGAAQVSSSGTTFGGLVGTFAQQTLTYGQLAGGTGNRSLLAITSSGTVAQFSSSATGDLGAAVETRYLAVLPNSDPTRRQYVRELRLNYRADSASSVTVGLSADFGTSFVQEFGVALPAAPVSGQTVIPAGFNAIYPSVRLQHDQGHRFSIQEAAALVERVGRA